MCERTGRVCLYSVEKFLVVAQCMLNYMADQGGLYDGVIMKRKLTLNS